MTILVAGATGLAGSAIMRELVKRKKSVVGISSKDVNLLDRKATFDYVQDLKPTIIIDAAAKVGGIKANNDNKADFIYQNLMIQTNVIKASFDCQVKKLLFLGSSCIYPKMSPQPIKEEYLLTGELETTNDAYSIAKISGIKMCQSFNQQFGTNYISAMPTNLYGFNDNYDLQNSHVIPALIRKFHEAKVSGQSSVEIWGTGTPMREFLYVDDLADACVYLMNNYNDSEIVNVGTGKDITIKELAYLVKDVVGFSGDIYFNSNNPDGTPRKLLDVSKLEGLGWSYKTSLREGLEKTYLDYMSLLQE